MFKKLHYNRGQANMNEYAVIFFLVVGAVMALSTFAQRGFQARIRDATLHMINMAEEGHGDYVQPQYEVYYQNVNAEVRRASYQRSQLLAGGETGYYLKNINQGTSVNSVSLQEPPRNANDGIWDTEEE